MDRTALCAGWGNSTVRRISGAGRSQQTWCRRPHVRHSYCPCEGHIGFLCINLHQRSAIRVWVGFIDPPSLAVARLPPFGFARLTVRACASAAPDGERCISNSRFCTCSVASYRASLLRGGLAPWPRSCTSADDTSNRRALNGKEHIGNGYLSESRNRFGGPQHSE
jgi:hypothetical protein